MGPLTRDIGFAVRHWRKAPGFTVAAAFTVALGIGATTTVFSVADALLARTPAGVREPRSLVAVRLFDAKDQETSLFSHPEFEDFRDGDNGLEQVAALDLFPATVGTGAGTEPEVVSGMAASASYFSILETRPHLGRFFLPEEDVAGNPVPVVVLSHRYWARRMGADPSVVGRTVSINRTTFTVIGVAEEGFGGHVAAYDFSLWIPLAVAEAVTDVDLVSRGVHRFSLIARLLPGASLHQAQAAADLITERMRAQHPEEMESRSIVLEPYSQLFEEIQGPITAFMALLFALSGVVLLIASVNVGGMLLASATGRGREMGVRLALGASRGALLRQLLTESVLLFLLGGSGGVVLAVWATRMLGAVNLPTPVPVALDVPVDGGVLVFTLACALATGLIFGLAPALRATGIEIRSALVHEGAGVRGRGGRLRNAFVVAQVAGSVVLLATAGILVRGLGRAGDVDLGFDPRGVHVLSFDLSLLQYTEDEGVAFLQELRERAGALPEVEHAAVAQVLPLGFSSWATVLEVPGREADPGRTGIVVDLDAVTPDFFSTLAIPTVAGRGFDATEAADGTAVVINRTAAQRLWPGEAAVGKSLHLLDREMPVVGVVADGKYRTLGEAPRAMVYVPLGRRYSGEMFLLARGAPSGPSLGRELRDLVRSLDADIPIQTNASYAQLVGMSLLPNRVAAGAAGAFGLAGLVLAAIGLYGVLSYAVGCRTREVGIRLALGADVECLRRTVLMDGVRLVGVGLLVGLPVALGASWLLRGMLYGMGPLDPATYAGVAGLLTAVGGAASYLPARRATRVDPVQALRSE